MCCNTDTLENMRRYKMGTWIEYDDGGMSTSEIEKRIKEMMR